MITGPARQAYVPRKPAPTSVVVTGVCGFIGSHLAEALLRRGDVDVLGVDRLKPEDDPRTAAVLKELQSHPRFRLLPFDVGDRELARHLWTTSAVVHLAASTDVAASWEAGFADQAASLLSTQQLLDACWRARVPHLVVASSAHVYRPTNGLAREDVPAEPTSPYGVTKLAMERLAVAYARRPESEMSAVALRFFTAFGPRCNPAMVVARMFRSALTGEPMPLFGDGTVAHTWTHVDDLVRALLLAIGLPMEAGAAEVVNVAGTEEASLLEVADVVGEIVGSPVIWKMAGERAGDTAGLRADLTRAQQILGFTPAVGLREGLERLWPLVREGKGRSYEPQAELAVPVREAAGEETSR